jgi:hypothetical protein
MTPPDETVRRHPRPGSGAPRPVPEKPPDYDMRDDDELNDDEPIKAQPAPLQTALQYFRGHAPPAPAGGAAGRELSLLAVYCAADRKALRSQSRYRWLALAAVTLGTLAILAAIYELGSAAVANSLQSSDKSGMVGGVEKASAILAGLAVAAGGFWSQQRIWLRQRSKAERCRLLKFESLIDPKLWSGRPEAFEEWKRSVDDQIRQIQDLERTQHFMTDEPPDVPRGLEQCDLTEGDLEALLSYYRDKRLEVQMAYFWDRADRFRSLNERTRRLPILFFFGSVAAVLVRALIDVLKQHHWIFWPAEASEPVSIALITVAASLPVFGVCVRTWRSAFEVARSASLFTAKYDALDGFSERLKEKTSDQEMLRILWQCEEFLEGEHHEWRRLVEEAEWFI